MYNKIKCLKLKLTKRSLKMTVQDFDTDWSSDKFKCYKLWEEVDWQFSREILFWGAWYQFNLAI